MTARVGQPCPPFEIETMRAGELASAKRSDYLGKYALILFYPLDFTFVCPTELIAFSNCLDDFRKLGTEVLAVSIDSKFSHLAWWKTAREDGGIAGCNLTLGGDVSREMCKAFDVLNGEGVALRALFLVDREGVIRHATINDLPIGRNVDEALRVVEALRFHEEHGDVCPANWKPGDATMTPDPVKAREYFARNGGQASA